MVKEKYAIGGMSCAACAARVERAACALEGVTSCQVNLLQNSMQISYDESRLSPQLIEAAIKSAGYSAVPADAKDRGAQRSAQERALHAQKLRLIAAFVLTLLLMSLSMGPMLGLVLVSDALTCALLQGLLALLVMILERQYFTRGLRALTHLSPNMDSLVALGSAASFIYSLYQSAQLSPGLDQMVLHGQYPLYFESAAAILCLVGIGKYFESRAKLKSSQAVSSLIDLSPKLIRIRKDGEERLLVPEQVQAGDIVLLKAGENLGVDGTVIAGAGFMDQSSLTGESFPKKMAPGSRALSGTLLTQGYLEIKAEQVGADTTFAKILQLMDDTVSQKVPIARLADTIAFYFVPAVIALALITLVVWLNFAPFSQALNFALCVLVVSCPCALGLATPTAVMVGMGRAAKLGILFRSLEVLETLNKADTVVFDKTGTLTRGQMQLLSTNEAAPGLNALASLIMFSLESRSSHPLAAALVRELGAKVKAPLEVTEFTELPGLGLRGQISGACYYAGNIKLVRQVLGKVNAAAAALTAAAELSAREEAQGHIVLHVLSETMLLGSFVLGDAVKPDAPALIQALQQRGLTCLMFTGDREAAAAYVSAELGLDGYKAELLAADKLTLLKELQQKGRRVIMLGDGVNDALCLTQADVGIGVQGASDIAVSACDLVFMNARLSLLLQALNISALTYRNIKQNLFWAFIYNVLTIPLAAGLFYVPFGLSLNPMLAALLMSLSSLCVVSNALRLNFVNLGALPSEAAAASEQGRSQEKIMNKVISISGMHCNHCTASVQNALQALPGAQQVSVSLEDKCAKGSFPETISDEMIKGVIAALGFEVTAITEA